MKVKCNNIVIANKLIIADTFITRLIGLLGKEEIHDEGLLLTNCSSIHCFFMKFTIEVLYLSKEMYVIYKETLKPWKIGKMVKGAKHVLELPLNATTSVNIGDKIDII